MKKLLVLLALIPTLVLSQNSYIAIEAQYDFFGDVESSFEILDDSGAVVYSHAPTIPSELLIDTVFVDAGNYTVNMYDSYGDGWISSSMAGYLTLANDCQGVLFNHLCTSSNGFSTLTQSVNVGICGPNGPPPCYPATVILNLDQYQSETSWEIADSTGFVIFAGGSYGNQPDYASLNIPVCIPSGPLTFTIYDSYGDGLEGSLWQGQDGSYYLTQCNDTLVYGNNPAFGYDSTHTFQSDSCPPIPGCMDIAYLEYNPFADVSDSSCTTLAIYGCIDSTMYNYDSSANSMELIDSCDYTLILHDLMGNGWIGSSLTVFAEDTTEYYHTGGFTDTYTIPLTAPSPISFQFSITQQASLTTIECGFTLINSLGDTIISVEPPFIQPLFIYSAVTNCGNTCIEKVFGCPDILACNYTPGVNTPTSCTYPVTYYDCNNQCISDIDLDGVCDELEVIGCQDPLMYNYNSLATDSGNCEPFIYGCTDPTMFNYDSNANTDNGSCIIIVNGCTDSTMFNYDPLANTEYTPSNCEPIVLGCTNSSALNYNPNANIDDGSCITPIYGCTDSTMFNFNPLANVDNGNCEPFVYGCNDPSSFNYDPLSNTSDNSCCYIEGCTDPVALNYNINACYDDNSCILPIVGCTDVGAYNYDPTANVSDSTACLYDAGCYGGPGIPYWLNDGCYAWVIDVDDYCCTTDWDASCQSMYDYCQQGWPVGLDDIDSKIIMVYPNPSKDVFNIETRLDIEVEVYDLNGRKIITENSKRISLAGYPSGVYNMVIIYDDLRINKRIVKQ
jgi:hypothetical protein